MSLGELRHRILLESVLTDPLLEEIRLLPECSSQADCQSLLVILERVCYLIWEECSYSLLPVAATRLSTVQFAARRVLTLITRFDIDQDEWFGGATSAAAGLHHQLSGGRDRVALVLAISCTLLKEGGLFVECLEALSHLYVSPRVFVKALVRHDERCLTVALALLKMESVIGENPSLNPVSVLLHLFAHISFQYQTILDWLDSELVCLPFLCRFLDHLTSHLETWKGEAQRVQSILSSDVSPPSGTWVQLPSESANDKEEEDDDDDVIVIRVRELAGTNTVAKEIRLSRKPPSRVYVEEEHVDWSSGGLFDRLYDMLVRLRLRLEGREGAGIGTRVPTKKIRRLIQRFEEMVDDQ